jgi:hypothetical protein
MGSTLTEKVFVAPENFEWLFSKSYIRSGYNLSLAVYLYCICDAARRVAKYDNY